MATSETYNRLLIGSIPLFEQPATRQKLKRAQMPGDDSK
jgi:hypothetical protein